MCPGHSIILHLHFAHLLDIDPFQVDRGLVLRLSIALEPQGMGLAV